MTAFLIGALVGINAVFWTEVVSRGPEKRPGVFEERPMVGVAVICVAAVVGMWIHGNLA